MHSPGPVTVAGLFSTASGIGESARLCAAALDAMGRSPVRVDLSDVFGQRDLAPCLDLSPMPTDREGLLILHLNAPETERALFALNMMRGRRWRVIGYWAWELETLPPHWRAAQAYLSEIWTPSEFVARAVAKLVNIPVRCAPHALSHKATAQEISPHTPRTCLIMADGRSSFTRKGALDAISLFQQAFSPEFPIKSPVKLIVKTRNLEESPDMMARLQALAREDTRISFINHSLSSNERDLLLQQADIILSTHRSEGFGLHLAEAMAAGKLVVATAWSGNLEFMTQDNSLLIPGSPVPVEDPGGPYQDATDTHWSQPDISAGARMLREIAFDDVRLQAIGEKARADIRSTLTPARHLKWL